jgi:hypothetical protein
MHIIIGLLTALAGLIWAVIALQRSGMDIGAVNPGAWARRRRWRKQYGTKPLYSLQRPLEAAAVLIVGMLKQEGEISREQKAAVIDIFIKDFHLTADQAREALGSSVYLLKDEINPEQCVAGILEPSRAAFTPEQATSLIELLERVASLEGEATQAQQRMLQAVREALAIEPEHPGKW